MKFSKTTSDEAILIELGTRLAQRRLERLLTQAELAEQAGVSKRTVERLEGGSSVQLSSLLRILRTLDLLSSLESLVPPATPRPMELLRHRRSNRQRAPGKQRKPADQVGEKAWSWGDE